MQPFSGLSLILRGLGGQRSWQPQWRSPEPESRLRRAHHRRRRSRPGRRLLSGERARHQQCRRARKRLDRRRQYRAQHHDHPLQLSVRRERRTLRSRGAAVGGSVAGPQLQRHVLPARGSDAGAHRARCPGVQAPRARQPRRRGRQRVADRAGGQGLLPAAEHWRHPLPGAGSCAAAPRRHRAPRCRRLGVRARAPMRSASTSSRTAKSPASCAAQDGRVAGRRDHARA